MADGDIVTFLDDEDQPVPKELATHVIINRTDGTTIYGTIEPKVINATT